MLFEYFLSTNSRWGWWVRGQFLVTKLFMFCYYANSMMGVSPPLLDLLLLMCYQSLQCEYRQVDKAFSLTPEVIVKFMYKQFIETPMFKRTRPHLNIFV